MFRLFDALVHYPPPRRRVLLRRYWCLYLSSSMAPPISPYFLSALSSYDMRSKHTDKATHWKDKEYLNERGHFRTTTEPAILNIKKVEQRDEGEYLCRVDFVRSPTRNSKIYLTVIGKFWSYLFGLSVLFFSRRIFPPRRQFIVLIRISLEFKRLR